MFAIMESESIGSYLYRKQLFSGNGVPFSYSNNLVIQTSDSWRLFPIDLHLVEIPGKSFKNILEDHTLYNLFKPTSKPIPASIRSSRHQADYKSTPCKICVHCLNDQLINHGHFWFKREWLFYKTNFCILHQCYLQPLTCNNCTEHLSINSGIRSILRGMCIKCKKYIKLETASQPIEIPNIIFWFHEILNAKLPFFSVALIKRLLIESCARTGGNLDSSTSNLSLHLFDLCNFDDLYRTAPYKKLHPCEQLNKGHRVHHLESIFTSTASFQEVPFLMFWWILSRVFTNYSDFKIFLNEISVKKSIPEIFDNNNIDFDCLDIK